MAWEYRHALGDMRDAIDGIMTATAGKTLADYSGDWLLRHAVQRGIEIVSEASRALPDDVKALRPEIPWPRVRAIGNVLRHEYSGLSDQVIWGVVIDELPRLKEAVAALEAAARGPGQER